MLLPRSLPYAFLLAVGIEAQSTASASSSSTQPSSSALSSSTQSASATAASNSTSISISELATPTGSYISYASTITLANLGSMSYGSSSIGAGNSTSIAPTTTATRTDLVGSGAVATTVSGNSTVSSTSSSAQATNTTPCNGYPEFCTRQYSNITMVAAHNSPFAVPGNAASNQALPVTTQLNDGIRLIQAQTHNVNGTLYLCHTSCELLNAGTMQAWLTTINAWVSSHPYDVVTIILENGDYVNVENFVAPITASGLVRWAYTPPKIPMALGDWPDLQSMILLGKRVVFFMDYEANQTAVPWMLDEFSQLWETPFDPTDSSFPCTVQRPPSLSSTEAKTRMYMTNHNLNTDLTILGASILIPTTTLLNQTNAVSGNISLGLNAENCMSDWGRPPNFLNVDYYNVGNGSVFEVAAQWNNVTYTGPCCGLVTTSAAGGGERLREVVGRVWVSLALVVVCTAWMCL